MSARAPKQPAASKKALFDDSASSSSEDDQDDGGATLAPSAAGGLKINQEFARRFEHNKKREELQRLQEKYGANGDDASESSSDDETEDDEGLLVTEDLDAEISATLQAIKNKDPRIYDKEAVFYKPFDPETDAPQEKKEKPLFLRDYYRERYLAGDVGADDEDSNKPKTYAQEQADLKKSIVSEINAAAEDEEWSDDDAFLKPAKTEGEKPAQNGIHPSRAAAIKLTEVDVATADKNPEEFLSKFMASKAWAPPDGSKWQAFESDDGDDDINMADEIEHAYNIRFEDPTKSNEILKTYSRNMAANKSVRKEELTGRKRLRALEKEKKDAEKAKREEERARLRRLKVDEAAEKLSKIKEAAGLSGKALQDEDLVKFLADDDWEDGKWEEEMKKRFGDDYYAQKDDLSLDGDMDVDSEDEATNKKKKPKKPKWDDDIDIKDLIPEFEEEAVPNVTLTDDEQASAPEVVDASSDSDSDSDTDRPSKKRKTTNDIKKDKIAAKRQARQELAKIEAIVDAKMEIDNPRALASSSKNKVGGFRYRETSPTNFGLTARDILLAPSDAALNEFAGLKKLAAFRDAEKKRKDKKKLGKKARLRQWRREQFGREYEQTGPTFGFEKLLEGEEQPTGSGSGANAVRTDRKRRSGEDQEDKKEAVDGIVDGERKKKRKRSKGKKKGEAEAEAEA
ncbi:KRI1-like family C-terminal-domain-containing protein [Cercophora newfieldiana]|uniref:KRI1-like family C-terminal-domain-containing protein n=1 Tax=Cercophora newfieldiana TaxID=92897 RepID=A0AA39Y5B8_9PEZI|nr:KRI1-like family C-terminal-domain-containing protein [Cercophora newfieldiana]